MTPFQKAGYTEITKFIALRDKEDIKKGDVVTLSVDDGTCHPFFKTEDCRHDWICLPGMGPFEELEVYEEGK